MSIVLDILVPVYNGRQYIRPLLETLRAQGCFSSFRLIVADDGSTDGTAEELEALAGAYPFEVLLLRQKNAGVSAARNRCLAASDAPYFAFLDADDRVTPDYAETLLKAARLAPDVFVFCQQRTDGVTPLAPAGEAAIGPVENEAMLRRFAADPTRFGAVNLMVSRAFAAKNALAFAEGFRYYEDYHFILLTLSAADRVLFTEARLYDYVHRPGSAMARFNAARVTDLSLLESVRPTLGERLPAFAAEYEAVFVPRIYWSVLWQAALAAPNAAGFLAFGRRTGAKARLSKLTRHPDKTVAASACLYLLSPVAFFAAARALGAVRSGVKRTDPAGWRRILSGTPAFRAKTLVYGMSHVRGGVESYLRQLVRDAPAGTFDFLCDCPDIAYRGELTAKDCAVHFIPAKGTDPVGHLLGTAKVLLAHPEYETVYFNLLDSLGAYTAAAPFLLGRRVAVHSHSSLSEKPAAHRLLKPALSLMTDLPAACSAPAAAHMFTAKQAARALIVPNRVNAAAFRFDPEKRRETREALGLAEENRAVMHVGRLSYAKNPRFIADLARELRRLDESCRFYSVGSGDMDADFERYLRETGAENDVIRLGARDDVADLLQAADVFVLPSVYEGFPIVAVEAQAADLPCFLSDRVTKDAALTDKVRFLSVDEGVGLWAEAILAAPRPPRRDTSAVLREKGYDAAILNGNAKALLEALIGGAAARHAPRKL